MGICHRQLTWLGTASVSHMWPVPSCQEMRCLPPESSHFFSRRQPKTCSAADRAFCTRRARSTKQLLPDPPACHCFVTKPFGDTESFPAVTAHGSREGKTCCLPHPHPLFLKTLPPVPPPGWRLFFSTLQPTQLQQTDTAQLLPASLNSFPGKSPFTSLIFFPMDCPFPRSALALLLGGTTAWLPPSHWVLLS